MYAAEDHAVEGLPRRLDRVDRWVSNLMARWGLVALRWPLGIVFIWFGLLKPLGLSAAEPLVILPDVAFQPGGVPYAPTVEGQYIIKNLVIIAAALVVGGTVRSRKRLDRRDPTARSDEGDTAPVV